MSPLSTYLYARPSFLEGVGRILDLGDTLTEFNRSMTPAQADALAMAADWRTVGADLVEACQNFGNLNKVRVAHVQKLTSAK